MRLVFKKQGFLWLLVGAIFLFIAALASVWHFTPLRQYVDMDRLRGLIELIRGNWWTPLAVLPVYLVGNSLLFPNMVLNSAIILTLGGTLGWVCAMGGSLTAAASFFFLGKRLDADKLDFLRGKRFEKAREFLRKGGIGTVLAVRMMPIAPYSIVNIAAGTIDLRFRDFFIGTFIAHLPGTLTLAIFGEQLETAIRDPSSKNMTILALVALLGFGLFWTLRRYVRRKSLKNPDNPG